MPYFKDETSIEKNGQTIFTTVYKCEKTGKEFSFKSVRGFPKQPQSRGGR